MALRTQRTHLRGGPFGPVGPSFPTLDPASIAWDGAHLASDSLILSNGNLTAVGNPGGTRTWGSCRSTLAWNSGKHFFEAKAIQVGSGAMVVGVGNTTTDGRQPGDGTSQSAGWWSGGGNPSGAPTFVANDVIGVACDAGLASPKVWFYKNGVILSGDPVAGTGGFSLTGSPAPPVYPYIWCNGTTDQWTLNFGATAFAFTPPTGYNSP